MEQDLMRGSQNSTPSSASPDENTQNSPSLNTTQGPTTRSRRQNNSDESLNGSSSDKEDGGSGSGSGSGGSGSAKPSSNTTTTTGDANSPGSSSYEQSGSNSGLTPSQPSVPSTVPEANATRAGGKKRSRYLKQSDRRNIIRRLQSGERQSDLAREYGVTRAAICHINKNRAEILSRSLRSEMEVTGTRFGNDAFVITNPTHSTEANEMYPTVLEVRSPTMTVLLTALRNKESSCSLFRNAVDRATRLLLEEALACSATKTVKIVTASDILCEGMAPTQRSFGISMSEAGFIMLESFRAIQPDSPTGFITLEDSTGRHGEQKPMLKRVCAPPNLGLLDVFLLEATLTSGLHALTSIQALLDFGAKETSVILVCIALSASAAQEILRQFPNVRIVTASVDPAVNDSNMLCPGIGDFLERYFNMTVVQHNGVGLSVDL